MAKIIKTPGQYIQGPGELARLGAHAKKMGQKFFLLSSANNRARLGAVIEASMKEEGKEALWAQFGGQCSKAEIARVQEEFVASKAEIMVGLGGGKVIDTAKAVADNLSAPVVVAPTVASNDAPCTGIAVIYNDQGIIVKAQFTKRNPDLVVVDSEIIAKAPLRLFAAGLGDALATWFEARAAHASGARNVTRGVCSDTVLMMSRLCYDLLMQNALTAMADVKQGRVSEALEKTIEAAIYLSGVGSESGGLAAAHAVNDSLPYLPGTSGLYHGEKVAFGVLVQLALEKSRQGGRELDEVRAFLQAAGLPMTFAQLGASGVNPEDLRKVAEAACKPAQFTKNLPFPVTVDDMNNALLEADRLGREFEAR
jgi:glycerol dehydrogenase